MQYPKVEGCYFAQKTNKRVFENELRLRGMRRRAESPLIVRKQQSKIDRWYREWYDHIKECEQCQKS